MAMALAHLHDGKESAKLRRELDAVHAEFDQFVVAANECERELESECDLLKRFARDQQLQIERLASAREALQAELTSTGSSSAQARDTQREVLRRLEQTNDELETALRVANATIADLAHRVDVLTEELVLKQLEFAHGAMSNENKEGTITIEQLEDPNVVRMVEETTSHDWRPGDVKAATMVGWIFLVGVVSCAVCLVC